MTTQSLDKKNFPIPPYYSNLSKAKLETNRNILGMDMQNAALNMNYLVANGLQKIPYTYIGDQHNTVNTPIKYALIDFHNVNFNERLWGFEFTSAGSPGIVNVQITSGLVGSSVEASYNVVGSTNQRTQTSFLVNEPITYETTGYNFDPLTIQITPSSSTATAINLGIQCLSMTDVPRAFINPTTQNCEYGVDIYSNTVGSPVFTIDGGGGLNSSYGGLAKNLVNFKDLNKWWKSLWSYTTYYAFGATDPQYRSGGRMMYSNSTIPMAKINVFSSMNIPQPIVYATQDYFGQATKQCIVAIYASNQDPFDTSEFEIVTPVGACVIQVVSTTPQWYVGYLDVECENVLSSSYGGVPRLISNMSGNLDINLYKSSPSGAGQTFNVWTVQLVEFG